MTRLTPKNLGYNDTNWKSTVMEGIEMIEVDASKEEKHKFVREITRNLTLKSPVKNEI